MIGKVVQILGIPFSHEFEVIYGYENDSDNSTNRFVVDYGTIQFTNSDASRIYVYGGYNVNNGPDGFKDVYIHNGKLPKDAVEETLIVVIPQAIIETTSKKIAGRYAYEGIFEMHAGDTITISKFGGSKRYTFMAVQAGNEIFLIKKTR